MKTKEPSKAQARTSRRRFAQTIAASIAAVPLAKASLNAQTAPAAKEATAPPNPQPAAQPKPSPVAEAYAEVGRLRFGDKLTPTELARMKSDLEGNIRTADRLRAFKLKNSDEPDFIFTA